MGDLYKIALDDSNKRILRDTLIGAGVLGGLGIGGHALLKSKPMRKLLQRVSKMRILEPGKRLSAISPLGFAYRKAGRDIKRSASITDRLGKIVSSEGVEIPLNLPKALLTKPKSRTLAQLRLAEDYLTTIPKQDLWGAAQKWVPMGAGLGGTYGLYQAYKDQGNQLKEKKSYILKKALKNLIKDLEEQNPETPFGTGKEIADKLKARGKWARRSGIIGAGIPLAALAGGLLRKTVNPAELLSGAITTPILAYTGYRMGQGIDNRAKLRNLLSKIDPSKLDKRELAIKSHTGLKVPNSKDLKKYKTEIDRETAPSFKDLFKNPATLFNDRTKALTKSLLKKYVEG